MHLKTRRIHLCASWDCEARPDTRTPSKAPLRLRTNFGLQPDPGKTAIATYDKTAQLIAEKADIVSRY